MIRKLGTAAAVIATLALAACGGDDDVDTFETSEQPGTSVTPDYGPSTTSPGTTPGMGTTPGTGLGTTPPGMAADTLAPSATGTAGPGTTPPTNP